MPSKSVRSGSGWSARDPAVRVGSALIALAVGGAFALDTWERGWTLPGVTALAVALLAAGCAAVGRATRRPALERAAGLIAVGSLVVALAAVVYRLRD